MIALALVLAFVCGWFGHGKFVARWLRWTENALRDPTIYSNEQFEKMRDSLTREQIIEVFHRARERYEKAPL